MPDQRRPPTCGFRLSIADVLMTVVVAVASLFAIKVIGPFAILLPFVFGHFLLFCNVFRIGNDFELIWAIWLIVVFNATLSIDCFDWWLILALQTPLTLTLIALAIRSPGYHGIGCRRINPHLQGYLDDPRKYEGVLRRTARRLLQREQR